MPHVELSYSDNLTLNTSALFDVIESTINQHDATAGACKSRAYPAVQYKHTHLLVTIDLLTKAHRDEAFTQRLLNDLNSAIKKYLPRGCCFSLALNYRGSYYLTMDPEN